MNRWIRPLLLSMTILLITFTAVRAYFCWAYDYRLIHVSGTWIALASDLKEGIFYRPLFGEFGFGGTRYFPLHFVLHAALLKMRGDPRVTGYVLEAVATILLLTGVHVLLRRLGLDRMLAGCSAILVLAAWSAQLAPVTIRGDVLPAALNVWGLAVCSSTPLSGWGIVAAAILFTLAWSAKVSTVFGFAGAFLFLILSGRRRLAWRLAGLTATGFILVLGAIYFASGGRIIQLMRATAWAGATPSDIIRGPFNLLYMATVFDPGAGAFLLLASAALFTLPRKSFAELPPLFFLTTVGMTALIVGTPGSNYNHFLDLQVASIVLFSTWVVRGQGRNLEFGLAALALAAVLVFPFLLRKFREEFTWPRRSRFDAALQVIGKNPGPILSEHPLLPVLAGQHPYVLDAFYFRVLRRRDPSFAQPLWTKLQERQFDAVVLLEDPHTEQGQEWYTSSHFGEGFVQAVENNYELVAKVDGLLVYRPRRR